VSPGIIREGRRNPRRHSHSFNLLKMRQVYNWVYLAGLIAILCINFSSQEPDQNSASDSTDSEIEDDSPLWPYFYSGGSYSGNQEELNKRMLPYIVHKRMPYIVHKRMPYIVHKKRMSYVPVHKRMSLQEDNLGDEDIAKLLQKYRPRTLRMIPFIH